MMKEILRTTIVRTEFQFKFNNYDKKGCYLPCFSQLSCLI